ncbi:MAG TPA: STAS domain-containing protein [Thermoleophilaceae bacterium]
MATHFYIEIHPLDHGVTEVRLFGDADLAVAPELQEKMDALIREQKTRLLINLTELRFIDSTALGTLLHTARHARRKRGRVAVVCPDPAMRGLFELVGLNLIFPVEDSTDRALAHLVSRRRFKRRSASPPAEAP